jgi:hypothetical protein
MSAARERVNPYRWRWAERAALELTCPACGAFIMPEDWRRTLVAFVEHLRRCPQ